MSNTFTRRDLVAAAGAGAALAAMPARAAAAMLSQSTPESSAPTPELSSVPTPELPAPLVLLLDGSLPEAELAASRNLFPRLQPRVLQPDLVWEWRRNLGGLFVKGVRGVAITRWDKALLLIGLAREAAIPVRQMRVGPNAFQTDIG